jgi:NAD(P)-dependent dehydrogenase (short-subunit alcohol dehydrogenase family)
MASTLRAPSTTNCRRRVKSARVGRHQADYEGKNNPIRLHGYTNAVHPMQTLDGKVAVVTGAASGIGRAIAHALAARGTHIVVVDIDSVGISTLAADLTGQGGAAVACSADIAEPDAFDEVRNTALERFGQVDIVVNNVGVLTNGLPQDIPVAEWQRILNINLMSIVRSNAVFLPLLLDQGSGHVVNTASFAGLFTYSYDRLPYAASKAAIVQISEGLALYLRPRNIGVTLLCPGPVLTNIASAMPKFGAGAAMRTPGDQFELLDPAPIGELVAEAILHNRFFVPTHPQVVEELRRRVDNWDAYLDYQISREPSAPKGQDR